MKNNIDIENKILEIINSIKPYLNSDGGDMEFIKYEDGYVYIKLLGGCQNCAFANDTIQNGIYETLKQQLPMIKGIINVDF